MPSVIGVAVRVHSRKTIGSVKPDERDELRPGSPRGDQLEWDPCGGKMQTES
jgi:hypothetical protein